ncbi:disulfide isomerase [Artemisia annua]|uniref:Disulfide isomerase n=1 Tax=Artemisia annua TaxID=35608 RepID=A0A2U1M4S2_ARTAN|nr:disulfide isomerase [Artemisia annua]
MKVVAPISSAMKKVNYATGITIADVRKQPELENHVEIGGYSYPTLVALNIKKGACAPLKSASKRDRIIDFCESGWPRKKGYPTIGME